MKLILLDLDGTLCQTGGYISPVFNQVEKQLREKGITLGIASGRNHLFIKETFPILYQQLSCICKNGAIVFNKGKVEKVEYLGENLAKDLYEIINQIPNVQYMVHLLDSTYTNITNETILQFLKKGFNLTNKKPCNQEILSMSLLGIDDVSILDVYFDRLHPEYTLTSSGYGCIDILRKGISKKAGLLYYLDKMNITSEEVMAIGDEDNDLELLEAVGYPVAMKNANERVKRISKLITKKECDENGCLDFIIKYFDLKVEEI